MDKIRELRELIRLVEQSAIEELDLKNGGISIMLKKASAVEYEEPTQVPAQESAQVSVQEHVEQSVEASDEKSSEQSVEASKEQIHQIVSKWVGVFTAGPEKGALPYVKIGDHIKAGTTVCQCNVDRLHLSHDIQADVSGEIIDILVEDGQLIEYGQVLFLVKAE